MPICFCASGCARNPLADPRRLRLLLLVLLPPRAAHDPRARRQVATTSLPARHPHGRFGDVRREVERKLLPEELPRAAAGLCVEQTGYGMPDAAYCEQPGALLCEHHRCEHIEQYGPHPCPGAFLGYRNE